VASAFDASVFVSPAEAQLFCDLAPRQAEKVTHANNGVDLDYFDPSLQHHSPYPEGVKPLVFTGAMDYWPNVDAVQWFASEVLPLVRAEEPKARFYVVGGNPAPAVKALTGLEAVEVVGRVADVRPWLQHAAVAIAPLRVARGVQNKVLEALAMARPTVVTPAALEGISARPGESLLLADEPRAVADAILLLLESPGTGAALGRAGRQLMERDYRWQGNLEVFNHLLGGKESVVEMADD
jgi:sugar transferase (PEP-CTERM/EpsH1 system associated)